MCSEVKKDGLGRLISLLAFSMAFAYIEAVVVVYLRAVFYPDGFIFPIENFAEMAGAGKYVLIEIGREAATVVLVFTASLLMAGSRRRRLAYFLIIFAVWDIFYYVWLKMLLDWPVSIMDWDVLFLIPVTWAGPVLAPVITSITMLFIAAVLLTNKPISVNRSRAAGFAASMLMIIVLFCIAGLKITEPDYAAYFSWPVFVALHAAIIILLIRCVDKQN